MEELREEVGVKESFRRKLVRSRLKWAGHVERMEGERKRKTEAEVGGLYEEIFGGSGRGAENESKGWGK